MNSVSGPPVKKIKIATESPPFKSVSMKKEYIHLIRNGEKTIEGRVFERIFRNLVVGERIRFYYMSNNNDDVLCTVTKIGVFTTFREMLENCGYKKCIPFAKSLEEATKLYHSIPKYTEKEKKYGVVALSLELSSVKKNR